MIAFGDRVIVKRIEAEGALYQPRDHFKGEVTSAPDPDFIGKTVYFLTSITINGSDIVNLTDILAVERD